MSGFDDIRIDYLEFYVADLLGASAAATRAWGLPVRATAVTAGTRRALLGRAGIHLLLTEPRIDDHPGSAFVAAHGDGVCDIALRVADAAAAQAEAVRRGATAVGPPERGDGVVTARIGGFGDVTHTFVQRSVELESMPGFGVASTLPVGVGPDVPGHGLLGVDHLAVCLEPGRLDPTVEFYQHVLDFDAIFTEHIVVGAQAMNSRVVQSRSGAVTLTLIEPDTSREPGQIDQFLKDNGGPGVQHVAFATEDIVDAVDSMRAHGVEFLVAPGAYYRELGERIEPAGHSLDELERLSLLVDEDDHGQMFQVFARSVHPRKTFFVEVIERLRAKTFGSGNIKALYTAAERQRQLDQG